MAYRSNKGRLRTGRTIVLMVALVALIGVLLWRSNLLPFRLRPDGIYAGNAPNAELVDRPKLYLPAPEHHRSGFVRAVRVVDGDTLIVGDKERVRLIGIDTDEVGHDKINPQSTGWRAALFVQKLLEPDAQVKLKYDNEREDRYGRTLAYVYLPDGRMLNEVIMQEGWARVMTIEPNTKHAEEFRKLEAKARTAHKGRWR